MFIKTITILLLVGCVFGQFGFIPVPVKVDPIGIVNPIRPGGLLGGKPQPPRAEETAPVVPEAPRVVPVPAVESAIPAADTNATTTTKKPTIVKAPPRNV